MRLKNLENRWAMIKYLSKIVEPLNIILSGYIGAKDISRKRILKMKKLNEIIVIYECFCKNL